MTEEKIFFKLKEIFYQDIDQDFDFLEGDIELFCGTLIAAGYYTAVIDLNKKFQPKKVKKKFENPVLIISKDNNKHRILKKFLKKKYLNLTYTK